MVTVTPAYGTPTALTITLAGLATSATLVAGRESNYVDNSVDDAIDVLVGGKVFSPTSPANDGQIEVWAYASYDNVEFSGGATGVNAALTPTKEGMRHLITVFMASNRGDTIFAWNPISLASVFGFMPIKWGVWVTHNIGTALPSPGTNHEIVYIPVGLEVT